MKSADFFRPHVTRAATFPGHWTKAMLGLLLLAAALGYKPVAQAQDYGPPPGAPAFTQQDLDRMLAPIALYPDTLLAQILLAATHPRDVVLAAQWSRANPGLTGDRAVAAVAQEYWDPSVISLVALPQILAILDAHREWMNAIGIAYLAQMPQVMDSIQNLREQAYAAANSPAYAPLPDAPLPNAPPGPLVALPQPDSPVLYAPAYVPMAVAGVWWRIVSAPHHHDAHPREAAPVTQNARAAPAPAASPKIAPAAPVATAVAAAVTRVIETRHSEPHGANPRAERWHAAAVTR